MSKADRDSFAKNKADVFSLIINDATITRTFYMYYTILIRH